MTGVLLVLNLGVGAFVGYQLMRLVRVLEHREREATRPIHPSAQPARAVDLGPTAAEQHAAWYAAQGQQTVPAHAPYGPTGPFQRPEV